MRNGVRGTRLVFGVLVLAALAGTVRAEIMIFNTSDNQNNLGVDNQTDVGVGDGEIIFVDCDSVYQSGESGGIEWERGRNTGTSWEDAYLTLQQAFAQVEMGYGSEIWVAGGNYTADEDGFELVSGVDVYGGFNGDESALGERVVGSGDATVVTGVGSYVFLAVDVNDIEIDGITVSGGGMANVYCERSDITIDNCVVRDGVLSGIYCIECEPVIRDCEVLFNDEYGIHLADSNDVYVGDISRCVVSGNGTGIHCGNYCDAIISDCVISDNSSSGLSGDSSRAELYGCVLSGNNYGIKCENRSGLTVSSCRIAGNAYEGVNCNGSGPIIKFCVIEGNGSDGVFGDETGKPKIFNNKIRGNGGNGVSCSRRASILGNWIHSNSGYGIYSPKVITDHDIPVRNNTIVFNGYAGIYCGDVRLATVSNCIFTGNGDGLGSSQVYGCDLMFSCVYDPGNPSPSSVPDGAGNITADPMFAYGDPSLGNYHLDPSSPCVDMGDNRGGIKMGEVDFDGDRRLEDGYVDMGADEVACSDVSNEYDYDGDGVVGMADFGSFAGDRGSYDFDGMAAFADSWLWEACWR